MLSQKAKYGLRALVELARADGAQLSAGELSVRAGAPRKFLEAILLELSRNQIVVSRRGKFGGYVLARASAGITFAEIIRTIDGPLALAPCVSPRLPQMRRLPGSRHLHPARGSPARPRRHGRCARGIYPG
jgi:Rrf2 family protein